MCSCLGSLRHILFSPGSRSRGCATQPISLALPVPSSPSTIVTPTDHPVLVRTFLQLSAAAASSSWSEVVHLSCCFFVASFRRLPSTTRCLPAMAAFVPAPLARSTSFGARRSGLCSRRGPSASPLAVPVRMSYGSQSEAPVKIPASRTLCPLMRRHPPSISFVTPTRSLPRPRRSPPPIRSL